MRGRGGPRRAALLLLIPIFAAGCGRKGPPLPPLVRVPAAPADFVAERRGNTVEIEFTVPSANTDRTRPANIERVDVYGYTGPTRVTDADLLQRGTRIGSVDVKAPRDPNKTIDPDEPSSDIEPLQGSGLDQGAATQLFEELTADALAAPSSSNDRAREVGEGQPLVGPPFSVGSRSYISVGVSTGGRPGPFSRRATIPLGPMPPPPSQPRITYDENAITIAWTPPPSAAALQEPASSDLLPSSPVGLTRPTIGYHVYEVRLSVGSGLSRTSQDSQAPRNPQTSEDFETRLTESPVREPQFFDRRIAWGAERCYTVRTVQTIETLTLESEPARPACDRLADTFPPAPPSGLVTVASQGAISLIWNANSEKDLAGYVVLRGLSPTGPLSPITPTPIDPTSTQFVDRIEAGTPFVYAVQAVDKAGNASTSSARSAPETAR